MTTGEKKVLCNILEYLNDSNYANLLLSEELTGDPHSLWMNRMVEQTGRPNRSVEFYAFHGVGCSVHTQDYHVDFDYNSDGTIRTFNSFMVYHHLESRKTMLPKDKFTKAYEGLRSQGVLKSSDDITGREDELTGDHIWK